MTSSNCSSDEDLTRRRHQRHQQTIERGGIDRQHRATVGAGLGPAVQGYFVNNQLDANYGLQSDSPDAFGLHFDSENSRQQRLQNLYYHNHQQQQQQQQQHQHQQPQHQQQNQQHLAIYPHGSESAGFFDSGHRNTLSTSNNAMRSTDGKPIFSQQLVAEGDAMPRHQSFAFDAHQMTFGSGGRRNLTELSPMLVGSARSFLDLDHRQGQRSNRMREQQHGDLVETASPITIAPCYDDVKAPSSGLSNYGTGIPSTNLSPPHARLFDPSDDSNSDPPSRRTSASSSSIKRSDRKPIPDSQKDERYFERREKNNAAAKKSRDTRKQRIDAAIRERDRLRVEGEYLEAQLVAWRSACDNMRAMLRQANETHRIRHVTGLLLDGSDNSASRRLSVKTSSR